MCHFTGIKLILKYKLGHDSHCPWTDNGEFSSAQAYEVVQENETCFTCVVPSFQTNHKAVGQSGKTHDSTQNLNHSVCLGPIQVAYPADHRHGDP